MAQIRPFKGIRPKKGLEAQVASQPYDVLSSEEARKKAEGNPNSFLHVVKSEIDLDPSIDHYDEAVYKKAKENFELFMENEVLIQDTQACFYAYKQVMGPWAQTGLVACSSISDYFSNVIRKHEFTRPAKEKDRISHMKTTRVHSGPVFLCYPEVDAIDTLINEVTAKEPECDFTADDDVQHTLWVIDKQETIDQLVELFDKEVPTTYIADGHHRAASSSKVGKELAENSSSENGEAEYNYFLSVLFPANQTNIIDYNRVVKDLNEISPEDFLLKISEAFEVESAQSPLKPATPHQFGMYLEGMWYKLTAKAGTYNDNDPIGTLDISILSNNLLDPILDIKDQRTDNRIDFVGGIRGMEELERRVDSGEMAVAFSIFPVTIKQLMDIADSGEVMPPKSTWFEPKLRSGLVVHKF